MIRELIKKDRKNLRSIIVDTNHFNEDEVDVAMELIDASLKDPKQKDYIVKVYVNDDNELVAGYICYG